MVFLKGDCRGQCSQGGLCGRGGPWVGPYKIIMLSSGRTGGTLFFWLEETGWAQAWGLESDNEVRLKGKLEPAGRSLE